MRKLSLEKFSYLPEVFQEIRGRVCSQSQIHLMIREDSSEEETCNLALKDGSGFVGGAFPAAARGTSGEA